MENRKQIYKQQQHESIPWPFVYIPKVLLEGNGKNFLYIWKQYVCDISETFSDEMKRKKKRQELRERDESKGENWKENLCLLLKHGVDIIFVCNKDSVELNRYIEIKLNEPSKCFVKTKPILLKRLFFFFNVLLRSTHFKTHTYQWQCRQCVRWILASSGDTRTQKFNEIQRVLLLARILCVWQKFIIHTNHAW